MYFKMENIVHVPMLHDVNFSSITLWFTGRGGERIISLESFVWRTNSSTQGTYSTWAGSVRSTSSLISLLLKKQFVVWYFGPSLIFAGPTKNAEVNHLNWDEVRITAATKHSACMAGAKKGRRRRWEGRGDKIMQRGIAGKRSAASLFLPFPFLQIPHLFQFDTCHGSNRRVSISQHSAGGCLSSISNICFGKLQMQPPCEQIHTKTPLWGFNKIACSVLISHPVDK